LQQSSFLSTLLETHNVEHERLGKQSVEPDPLRDLYRDYPSLRHRLTVWMSIKILIGMIYLLGCAIIERCLGRKKYWQLAKEE
jgi:hypothetical protein